MGLVLIQLGLMVGPAISPVFGGILSQFLGWPAIFWFLTILAAIYLILAGVSLPETARNVVGDGSIPPQGWIMSLLNYMATREASENLALSRSPSHQAARVAQSELTAKRKLRWPNPLKTIHIILEKDVGVVLLFLWSPFHWNVHRYGDCSKAYEPKSMDSTIYKSVRFHNSLRP